MSTLENRIALLEHRDRMWEHHIFVLEERMESHSSWIAFMGLSIAITLGTTVIMRIL